MKLMYLILGLLILIGCSSDDKIKRAFYISTINGEGWGESYSRIYCDSLQMLSLTEAWVWVDGTKIKILAKNIRVHSN